MAGGATLVELREAARVARTAGRWQAAADAYGELLERFPGSPEAHNARVQLGDLLRVRLGDPARALGHYQAYVARGGPLDAEARFGAILCLRRLGEEAAASHATEEFLARYPNHLEAAELRAP
ncbi:MAG: tetratricopeptide repeat protein [Nannocystis sp.]|nr:tetratricopeptide repeat protein [Nannocystis sp.]